MIDAPIEHAKWQRERILGEHRHFRLNATCPACRAEWSQDFTDREAPAWINPVKLGLSLLCGGCEAKRRLIYVERAATRIIWSAPYFRPEDERRAWAVIRDPRNAQALARVVDLGPWVEHELPHPRATDPRLRDDRRDVCRAIMRPFRTAAWEVTEAQAAEKGWRRPPPPEGFRATTPQATTVGETGKGFD